MKFFITGGLGFIGSNFIRYLIRKYPDVQIINLDLLTYAGNLQNVKDVENHPNYHFIKGDICDRSLIHSLVAENGCGILGSLSCPVDVMINFAAETHVDRSIAQPDQFVYTNIFGTQVLLEAARKAKVRKFIQISTDEVYGSLDESGFFTEESPVAPNSPYSASKAGADLLLRAYQQTYGLPINIIRCSNNYGPYQFPEKLIPLVVINALQDKQIPVYGDGSNIRDWLHVEDHCSAIDLVVHKGEPGEIYNVGANNEWRNVDLVRKILSILNKPESLIRFVPDRPAHDKRYAIDATKIRAELDWQPTYTFDQGFTETVNWYCNHREWWSRLKNQ